MHGNHPTVKKNASSICLSLCLRTSLLIIHGPQEPIGYSTSPLCSIRAWHHAFHWSDNASGLVSDQRRAHSCRRPPYLNWRCWGTMTCVCPSISMSTIRFFSNIKCGNPWTVALSKQGTMDLSLISIFQRVSSTPQVISSTLYESKFRDGIKKNPPRAARVQKVFSTEKPVVSS